jgi:hypothetical protein
MGDAEFENIRRTGHLTFTSKPEKNVKFLLLKFFSASALAASTRRGPRS